MDRETTIKLTIKSLLEVVQTGAKNIEQEKSEEDAKKKKGRTPGTGNAAILTRGEEGSK